MFKELKENKTIMNQQIEILNREIEIILKGKKEPNRNSQVEKYNNWSEELSRGKKIHWSISTW